jgi:hypothetical protein
MYPWGDAPTKTEEQKHAFTVGETVYSGDCAGTVVTVDADKATMGIVWSDSDDGKPITYRCTVFEKENAMGVTAALVCILVANGSAVKPRVAPCEGPEFMLARCTKAPAEWWPRLKAYELDWARVDRNTFCLRVK